jgi:hypothetical protein
MIELGKKVKVKEEIKGGIANLLNRFAGKTGSVNGIRKFKNRIFYGLEDCEDSRMELIYFREEELEVIDGTKS